MRPPANSVTATKLFNVLCSALSVALRTELGLEELVCEWHLLKCLHDIRLPVKSITATTLLIVARPMCECEPKSCTRAV